MATESLTVFYILKDYHGPSREETDSFLPLFGQTVKKNHFFPQLLFPNCFWDTEKLRYEPEGLVTASCPDSQPNSRFWRAGPLPWPAEKSQKTQASLEFDGSGSRVCCPVEWPASWFL